MYYFLGLADKTRLAWQKQHRAPAIWGAVFGSLPPLSAFAFSHFGLNDLSTWRDWTAAAFVLACLLFSAPKVYREAKAAFGSRVEAAGFAVLLEGAMTLADHSVTVLAVVSYACLATLVCVNAVVTACSVALDQKATRAAAREAEPMAETAPLAVVRRPAARITAQRKAVGR